MESIEQVSVRAGQTSQRARQLLVYALLTAIASGLASSAQGQTFAEWFKQKKTQKKYLLEQIAALKAYSGFARKGYQIAHSGLKGISDFLQEEYILHSDHYDYLLQVSPAVRNNPQVSEIISWQKDILDQMYRLDHMAGLTNDEKFYLGRVSAALLKDCGMQMSDLQKVLTDHVVKMSDEDRLSLINRIHTGMSSNYSFASDFTAQAELYAVQRRRQQLDTRAGKQIYGIH